MSLPKHKTKIVATIGPASESEEMLEKLVRAGMGIARLNFSHGDFQEHGARIAKIRETERRTGIRVAIIADLPGPKMRLGTIEPEPVQLLAGNAFTVTAEEVIGNSERVSVSFRELPEVVKPGDRLFLNDGLVQLVVREVAGSEVRCRVAVGGELRSRKGLNLPGIKLGIGAFTERDKECLRFALQQGVDAVSQSFVETADDIRAVRDAARALGKDVFIIAKIERAGALGHIDEILATADGMMIARGDLGVEVPIEEIAIIQKELLTKAGLAGKPVITATQMLESMTQSRLPTRAEATDVANSILDGTDCVMLSGESAMGRFPEESVAMLARIAAFTEAHRPPKQLDRVRSLCTDKKITTVAEGMASLVEHVFETVPCAAVFVPTLTGTTARMISRFKPPVWIAALTRDRRVCQALQFCYGVLPVELTEEPRDWRQFAAGWAKEHEQPGKAAMLVAGPSPQHPAANYRIEFLILGER